MDFSFSVSNCHMRMDYQSSIFICQVPHARAYFELTLNIDRFESTFLGIESKAGFIELADKEKHT